MRFEHSSKHVRAKIIGSDRASDLAVLKLDCGNDMETCLSLKSVGGLAIGTSSDLQPGNKVFAIGNPFGLDQTLTSGIVSGLGREIPTPN